MNVRKQMDIIFNYVVVNESDVRIVKQCLDDMAGQVEESDIHYVINECKEEFDRLVELNKELQTDEFVGSIDLLKLYCDLEGLLYRYKYIATSRTKLEKGQKYTFTPFTREYRNRN